jgi:hypothetical protein
MYDPTAGAAELELGSPACDPGFAPVFKSGGFS